MKSYRGDETYRRANCCYFPYIINTFPTKLLQMTALMKLCIDTQSKRPPISERRNDVIK